MGPASDVCSTNQMSLKDNPRTKQTQTKTQNSKPDLDLVHLRLIKLAFVRTCLLRSIKANVVLIVVPLPVIL